MKKIILFLIFIMPFLAKATPYTSIANGNWSSSSTWSPTGVPGSGDNVTINSTVTLDANESVNTITINAMRTLTVSGSNTLTVYGNWTKNGIFTASTGLVTFSGSANQTIGGNSTTFYNLTINSTATVLLGVATTVSNNLAISAGKVNCQTNQLTGNSSGTFTMANGTRLMLGVNGNSISVLFPTNFTSAHITLTSGSAVSYLANTASQTISTVPIYATIGITSSSTLTKTPSGTYLNIAGNLIIESHTTLSETTDTINLGGIDSIKGGLSFTTGRLNVGGNFVDNGTFTCGTGTVNFDGSANQKVNGTSTPSFYNLTEDQAASTDSLFLTAPTTVSNTLTVTQGILDCQKHQLTNSVTPVVSLSPSSAAICNGSSTTLTASNYTNYIWTPGTGLSSTTGTSVTANPTSNTTYTIYGSSSGIYTCGVGTDAITVNSLPTIAASTSSASVCPGSSVNLTSTPSGGTSPYTYNWTPVAYGDYTCSTCQNTTAYPFGTPYTVTVTDANRCKGSGSVSVTVYPFPYVTITGPLSPTTAGNSDTLIASGLFATSYLWSTGATTSSIIVAPTVSTSYSVKATNSVGCYDSARYTIDTNKVGNGKSSSTAIRIVPGTTCNPSSFSSLDSAMWFYFAPTDSNNQIVAISNYLGMSVPHVHRLTLYDSAQHIIEDEHMPDITGASELRIDASHLHIGKKYLIRAARTPANANMQGNNPTPTPIGVDNASMRWDFQMCFRTVPVFVPIDSGSEAPAVQQLYYENRGQIGDLNGIPRFDIGAYSNNVSPAIYCSDSTISFVIRHLGDSIPSIVDTFQRVEMTPTGTNVQPTQRLFKMEKDSNAGYLNYFLGFVPNGVTNVFGYSRIVYKNIYPNIDLHVYSNFAGTKFYFVCNPTAGGHSAGNPANIELNFNGATSINDLSDSGISIVTPLGNISFAPGYAYEDSAGVIKAKSWHANFEKVSSNVVRFHTGTTNTNEPLIIQVDQGHKNPESTTNLEWSTYCGGGTNDCLYDVSTDASSNVYTTGVSQGGFPATFGSFQYNYNNFYDAVVVKFNSLNKMKWATYYGGSLNDVSNSVVADASGNVYITGYTFSSDFPLKNPGTTGVYYQNKINNNSGCGESDAFIAMLDITGAHNIWSTYYGGCDGYGTGYGEVGNHLALDGNNNLFIVGGHLKSIVSSSLPLYNLSGAYNSNIGTGFILKFSIATSTLGVPLWATDIGGNNDTNLSQSTLLGCAVDASNNLYVSGNATESGYPIVSPGGNGTFQGGGSDGVVTKIDATTNNIDWSTYYGGDGSDACKAITTDPSGNVYITGWTSSPTTTGGISIPLANPSSKYYSLSFAYSFIGQFTSSGTLFWSTYFGGVSAFSYGEAIAVDLNYDVYITGYVTSSCSLPLPTANPPNTYSTSSIGGEDGFIAAFGIGNPTWLSSTNYIWGTYLGGVLDDRAYGIATDPPNNKLYVDGFTLSGSSPAFPLDNGGGVPWFDGTYSGVGPTSGEGFISRFNTNPVIVAGVENISNSNGDINVYPNPSSESITVQLELLEKQNVMITMYDLLGKVVYYEDLKNQTGVINKQISVSLLAIGTYILKVQTGNNVYTKKIAKQS